MRTETTYHTLECAAERWIEMVVTSEGACCPTRVEDLSIGTCCRRWRIRDCSCTYNIICMVMMVCSTGVYIHGHHDDTTSLIFIPLTRHPDMESGTSKNMQCLIATCNTKPLTRFTYTLLLIAIFVVRKETTPACTILRRKLKSTNVWH